MSVTKLGLRGVNGRFRRRLEELTAAGWQGRVGILVDTDQVQEDYRWANDSPAVREWKNGRKINPLTESGFILVNKLYEATIGVDVDDLRRDKWGQIMLKVDDLARRASEHWHELITAILEGNPVGYDGVSFFNSAHTAEGESGAQDNDFSNADLGVAAAAAPTNPTPAEMQSRIKATIQKILAFKDTQGKPMNSGMQSAAIMVPANMWGAAQEAVKLSFILEGGQTKNNLLAAPGVFNLEVIVNPRLASSTIFYMFRTDDVMKPIVLQRELETTQEEDDSFYNNRILFGVKLLRNAAPLFWQQAAKITVS